MKITEKVEGKRKTFTEVVDVVCDICKKSTRDQGDMNFEYAELAATWGFYSKKDCEQHNCHMCETCYDKIRAYIHSIGGVVQTTDYSPGCHGPISVPDYPDE
tara:strand:+ start:816 stop:1121 length:306 start_codon:yes stop_codon:yes gene_type:complete